MRASVAAALLPAGLLAAAVLALVRTPAPARLSALRGRPEAGEGRGGQRRPPVVLACVGTGIVLWWLLGSMTGAAVGLGVALAGPRLLRRLEAADPEAARVDAQLPLVLELLSACLAGGAEVSAATVAVAGACEEPVAGRLRTVAGLLALGAPAHEAWGALAGSDGTGPAAAAARALARSAQGGAPVAEAVRDVAAQARRDAAASARERARRAGVLAVAPLGLCFLPAFVLAGVVPAVLGLAGPLLDSLR